jgi:hypothetical protein
MTFATRRAPPDLSKGNQDGFKYDFQTPTIHRLDVSRRHRIGVYGHQCGINHQHRFSGPLLVSILLTGVIGAGFLLLAACFLAMQYEISGSSLVIAYSPILRYEIKLAEIKSIRRRDLGFSIVSSFCFPGLVLFGVPYPEIGTVNMCATASSNGILIIETESKKYGITPADEAQFVAELRKRMRA